MRLDRAPLATTPSPRRTRRRLRVWTVWKAKSGRTFHGDCMLPLLTAIVLHLIIAAQSTSSAVSMTSRAAIAQLRSTSSKKANLLFVAQCTGWAKREGASMLFLPECLGFMGDSARHTLANTDPPIDELLRRDAPTEADSELRKMMAAALDGGGCDGPAGGADGSRQQADEPPVESIIRELQFMASTAKLWISGGGVHTRAPESEKIHNTHVIIDSDGRIRAHYHKMHLFDVSIPGKVALRESNTTDPGDELVVVDSPLGKLGLGICYDMRFPEMYVELVRRGAEVLLAPSAFTVPTGRAHWHALLRGESLVHSITQTWIQPGNPQPEQSRDSAT